MTIMTYGASGISPRTNVYAERQMLKHAPPHMVLEVTALNKEMPKNKTQTIKFRRPNTFSAQTTPLAEGVTPTATAITFTDVTGTIAQYGQVSEITDVIEDTHEDPILREVTRQQGENIGRTMEALDYAVVRAGTNVFYANGSARGDVNTVISLSKLRAVTRALERQKAEKFTQILAGSPDFNTTPIEAAYIGICHVDVKNDIRNLAGFTPMAEYGSRRAIHPMEFGTVEDIRFICSADLGPFADAGDTAATNGVVSTTGTDADVYPVMVFGREAWGRVALRGMGAVSPTIIPVGQKTKDDPLGQRGIVGWKTWHLALILNDLWMARLEVAVTDL